MTSGTKIALTLHAALIAKAALDLIGVKTFTTARMTVGEIKVALAHLEKDLVKYQRDEAEMDLQTKALKKIAGGSK